MNSSEALVVKDLTVEYALKSRTGRIQSRARAVDNVSFSIATGETLALVGESGSGKSSIANAIMRLVDPSVGSITVAGREVTSLSGRDLRESRRDYQMIFQDPFESIDPRRTVLDTVMESLIVSGIGETDAHRRERALAALESVGLTPAPKVGERFAHQLSGGQRQRVAIAAAMVLQPKLLVADEPVSMLDVSLRAGILRLMQKLGSDLDVACLFITHDLSLAWMYADRIAVLYLGRIVEVGAPADIIGNPKHPYTQALVSVIPIPERVNKTERTILTGEIPDSSHIPQGCRFHTRCPLYRALGEPASCRDSDPSLSGRAIHRVACHHSTEE